MASILVNAPSMPAMPWEERPADGRQDIMWRYSANPVIRRDQTAADTGRVAVYYGCADTVTGLAFGKVDEIVDFVKKNSIV